MTAKKVIGQIHLWLGFITGIIVFIVSITGAIYVFQEELSNMAEPWRKVAVEKKPEISPLQMERIGAHYFRGAKLSYFIQQKGKAVEAVYTVGKKNANLFLDPYTGKILHAVPPAQSSFDFFGFVLQGHRSLWFPYNIGSPIVNYATLGFVILLISGLVLWWPKNKSAAKQRYWFRWKDSTQWKRKNYDLHNILGFYAMVFLLCIALTGMVWGLNWVSQSLYWATSGGNIIDEYKEVFSDTTKANKAHQPILAVDKLWHKFKADYPTAYGVYISVPENNKATIYSNVYMVEGKYYRDNSFELDQYTLKPIERRNDPFKGDYEQAGFGARLRRMNYDIHVGAIFGLPGKFLAFFAAIISATLPITGVYIWWGRRKKVKKGAAKTPKPKTGELPSSPTRRYRPSV
ncbi:PepSY-associated TM helix domain-containing protein [Mucilaginibacter pedocola]|uniref:Peptidase M4 n=1 Tax=Mucilaginibacter pedocola TaxID=1792845 RepID=A0A1S9PAF2_9SPHI|nr:PepSY-associated TM helix domain-containing protein [Mucilaginibacter pedocola]OOQ57568.1 hypothetical protein BC343_12230 [Mucilaginibacter pedocola]